MNQKERYEIRLWLTQHTILQWVSGGMSLTDAKNLWEEMGRSGE